MTTIVSRRHFIKFYASIVFATAFFIAMGSVLLFVYSDSIGKQKIEPKDHLMLFFSIACYLFAVYGVYRYVKNAPTITIGRDFINFNGQVFSISDINKLELSGKRPFKYAVDFPMEAATLTFKNGDKKYIFDDMYANTWEMKLFLKQTVIDKKGYFEINNLEIDKSALVNDSFETFRGNQFTSLRGLSLWGLIGFFGYMLVTNNKPNGEFLIITFSCVSIFWFVVHCYLMNYFKVSDNFFVVRNHNYFWKKHIYGIRNIKEIVFETQGKMPNCLRIITNDFRSKLYPAATLRDRDWLKLKNRLEACGIEVRNECI